MKVICIAIDSVKPRTINHGISYELLEKFQNGMSNFFALPYDIKVKLKRNAKNARGYFDDE